VADVTFDCSITCTSDAHLWVNDNEVPLDESGLTKTGQFTAQTAAKVHLRAQLEGVKDSVWSLDITPECQGKQPQKLWARSGVFKKGGLILRGDAEVPTNPCKSKDGLELSAEVLPGKRVTPRKGTKRGSRKAPKTSE
jgi:hypothetical protein